MKVHRFIQLQEAIKAEMPFCRDVTVALDLEKCIDANASLPLWVFKKSPAFQLHILLIMVQEQNETINLYGEKIKEELRKQNELISLCNEKIDQAIEKIDKKLTDKKI